MKIDIPDHSREELTKLRCWFTGYHAGKGDINILGIPGELILRQLIVAIDKKKDN